MLLCLQIHLVDCTLHADFISVLAAVHVMQARIIFCKHPLSACSLLLVHSLGNSSSHQYWLLVGVPMVAETNSSRLR